MNLERIKLVAFAIDGVLTDGKLSVDRYGNASKAYSRRDMYAAALFRAHGIKTVAINTHFDECDEFLQTWKVVDAYLWGIDKRARLEAYLKISSIKWGEVAYIGSFEDDMDCLCLASWSACPRDSIPNIKPLSQFVSQLNGGEGVIYDFALPIIETQEKNNR